MTSSFTVLEHSAAANFFYDKHVNYLLKSLKRIPPGTPVNTETHRLSILFFIVSGLDLLGALDTSLDSDKKKEIIDWIYSHQVIALRTPRLRQNLDDYSRMVEDIDQFVKFEGHSGFKATSLITNDISLECGNISMTYCALASLCTLGDDLSRVDRDAIITGLKYLQKPDGSFQSSILGGESDMRLIYCAVAVSAILNNWSGVDKNLCTNFIKSALSHEGAFGQCPGAEAHGGSTYCAIASLKLMSKFDETLNANEIDQLTRWCLNRLEEGFNGRPNKEQDTCYSFWIGACLVMLDNYKYIEQENLLNFILIAQEERGGLSKVPAFYSDPLHTYLGLAGLTFVKEDLKKTKKVNLSSINPMLNMSTRASGFLKKLHDSGLFEQ